MSFPTVLQFVSIPGLILTWAGLLPLDKILFGLFAWHAHGKEHCWPAAESWAQLLGCDLRTIRASIRRLVKAGCLTVHQVDGQTVYRVLQVKDVFYLRVTVAVLARIDLSFAERLGLALVAFNCRGSEDRHGWARQETMAAWLGCSRRSVIRTMNTLKDLGLIEVRRRGPRSNQYSLTPAGEAAIVAQQTGKRCDNFARPYKEENESSKEAKRTVPVPEISAGGLSGSRLAGSTDDPEKRAFERLVEHGVHRKVAESLVYMQCHPPDSIDQAINNALLRQADHRQKGLHRLKPFSLAGYIVGSLNAARREAHTIKPSRLFTAAGTRHEQTRAFAHAPFQPLPEAEFEERRRRCIEQLQAAAG